MPVAEDVRLIDRWKMFFLLLFMGITPPLPAAKMKKAEKDWLELTEFNRLQLIKDLREQVIRKRQSMGENAARGSYKFAGIAFIVGAAVSLLVAPNTGFAAQILFRISVSIFLAGSGLLLMVISAKGKVMRRQPDYTPTGVEELEKKLAAQRYDRSNATMRYWLEYKEATLDLHKCEMHLLAERRGAFLVASPGVVAVIVMIVGVCIA